MDDYYDDDTLRGLPECMCGANSWKQDGLKIYCGNCEFVFFKGFPKGASDLVKEG